MLSPIEPAILNRAHPFILRAAQRAILEGESEKGRRIELSETPVPLEPPHVVVRSLEENYDGGSLPPPSSNPLAPVDAWSRFRVWLAPEQPWEWCRSELWLKHLAVLRRRVAWEIFGNDAGITFQLVCDPGDASLIKNAFKGQFEQCHIAETSHHDPFAVITDRQWREIEFAEFYPDAPYFKLLTRPLELRRSPYTALIATLAAIPRPALGLYQVLFAPVSPDHDWHQNVQFLHDTEFQVKLRQGQSVSQRYAQQMPSGDLRQMAMDLETKAHNDKPFFAVVPRLAILRGRANSRRLLRTLDVVPSLFQYGGRPLSRLEAEHFRATLSADSIRRMFVSALSHRPGLLANSDELSGLVHVPPPEAIASITDITRMLDIVPYDGKLSEGTPIGCADVAGTATLVCIPERDRSRHTHLIGRPGTGKTTLLERMILDDIKRGVGLAVLDPHGDLCERLLCLVPAEAVERTIYLDPGDPEWIPVWNPFGVGSDYKTGDVADGMIDVFKSFVENWGDRLEHILRNLFIALLSRPGSTLLDAADLLRPNGRRFEVLRRRFEEAVQDPSVLEFLQTELANYRNEDLSPPRNKLSKLLLAGTVSQMFSQPGSAFHLSEVMNKQMILLVNLAHIGSQIRGITGSMLIALFRQETLRRSGMRASQRRRFHIYCDEAHRFVTDSLEDMLTEARKYNVGMVLAHQYMRQFARSQGDALSSVGSKIVFAVDETDAEYLKKDLLGLVRIEDLIAQEDFQAVARIGRTVVRIRVPSWKPLSGKGHRDQIVERSRKLYCKPKSEVVAEIERRRTELDKAASAMAAEKPDRRSPPRRGRASAPPIPRKRPDIGENAEPDHDSF